VRRELWWWRFLLAADFGRAYALADRDSGQTGPGGPRPAVPRSRSL